MNGVSQQAWILNRNILLEISLMVLLQDQVRNLRGHQPVGLALASTLSGILGSVVLALLAGAETRPPPRDSCGMP